MKIQKMLVLVFFFSIYSLAQSYVFPVEGGSYASFRSAFGPRNLGNAKTKQSTDPYTFENYPPVIENNYDYDFHAGIDIAGTNGTNVKAVFDGIVEKIEFPNTNDERVFIKHPYWDDNGNYTYYLAMYMHINVTIPEKTNGVKTTVLAGDVIGTTNILNHLDIRYFPDLTSYDNYDVNDHDNMSANPTDILALDNYPDIDPPVIVNNYNLNEIDGNELVPYESDPITICHNQQGKYFEVGVRVEDEWLDMNKIEISLFGYDEDWEKYYTESLLNTDSSPSNPKVVNYNERINCGDKTDTDSDVGHNSSSVGIYPREFTNSRDDYQYVFFRWYV